MPQTIRGMPNANAPETRRVDMPLVGVQMDVRNVTRAQSDAAGEPAARFELVFTTGAPVRRYDWANDRYYFEKLDVSTEAINLDRLLRGAPLLNTHSAWRLEDQIGVVDQPAIDGGAGTVQAQLSRRDSVKGIVMDLEDRVIRNVSVGYVRDAMVMEFDGATNTWTYHVTRWTPQEVSLVPIPADMDSQVRSVDGKLKNAQGEELRSYPCLLEVRNAPITAEASAEAIRAAAQPSQENSMPQGNENGGASATPANPAAAPAASAAAATQETQRAADTPNAAADITELCVRHGVADLAPGMIRTNQTLDQARAAVLAELARRDAAGGGHRNVVQITTVTDQMQVRRAGIELAIMHRIDAATKLDDNARQYRGMSLLEIGRDYLEAHGVQTRGLDKMTLAQNILQFRVAGSMGTSDFSSLFANVANKRLRNAYDQNPGTYTRWARRAPNAPDFKSMSVIQLSGAPDLLQTNEHGEFKYGKMTDGAEAYNVLTYGRIVSLTRQALVNDDLRGFERLVTAFGFAASRLENRTVYAQLTANANLADGGALFNATAVTTAGGHANLASGAPSALQFSSLTTMRTAMRLQRGMANEELNLAPAFLIVPAALEQTAYQLTSSQYVPAQQSNVNEFREGGRTALTPIVEPILDANSATAWYAAAANSQIDTVEYCYLDGSEGPVIESDVGFEIDGVSWKCRLDFATKAIDFRGLYKSVGA